MKKYAKILVLLLVLSMIFSLSLIGCNTSGENEESQSKEDQTKEETTKSEPQEVVEISYTQYTAGGNTQELLDEVVSIFNEQNPYIKVESETLPYEDYFELMVTRIGGGNAPDVFEINFENFYTFASKGRLMDISPHIVGIDLSGLNKNALDAFQFKGKQYGFPESFGNIFMVYNKSLFDRAGVDYPTSDWTWADEIEAGKQIRVLGDDIFGVFQPIQIHEFFKCVRQNGGSLISEDGTEFTVNSPQNIETLQFLVDKHLVSNISPTQEQMAGTGDWDLFAAGRVGMLMTGPWFFSWLVDQEPDFDWDIAVEPGNTNKATHFFSEAMVVPKGSETIEQAVKFMTFMAMSDEQAKIRIEGGWNIPVVTDEAVLNSYLEQTPPESREVIFESLDYLITPPVVASFGELQGILNVHLEAARDGVATPKEALDAAQKELEMSDGILLD